MLGVKPPWWEVDDYHDSAHTPMISAVMTPAVMTSGCTWAGVDDAAAATTVGRGVFACVACAGAGAGAGTGSGAIAYEGAYCHFASPALFCIETFDE
jgi:hypothetical protein